MNQLPLDKRALVLRLIAGNMSMRETEKVTGVALETITKLLVNTGKACMAYHDAVVRNIYAKRVECDELHSFCCKNKRTLILKSIMLMAVETRGYLLLWIEIQN